MTHKGRKDWVARLTETDYTKGFLNESTNSEILIHAYWFDTIYLLYK